MVLGKMKEGGFPANFSYNRQIKETAPCTDLYSWSPYLVRMFNEPDHFGKLVLGDQKSDNILEEFDFNGAVRRGNMVGTKWGVGEVLPESKIYLDKTTFVTGGQSLVLSCTADPKDGRGTARLGYLGKYGTKLVPGKKYRLSLYVKGEIAPGSFMDARVWAGKTYMIPQGRMNGTFPWTKISGDFIVPPNGKVGFGIGLYGKGKVNIDHIVLQKID